MVVFSRISSVPVTDTTATLLDAAPDWSPLPPDFELWSEQFRPADYATNSTFANNFPDRHGGLYAPTLFANAFSNAFNGLPANGTWSLYIYDEGAPSHGDIVGGWSLMIATDGGSAAPTISDIPNQLTTVNTPTAAIPFTVDDADTPVGSLTVSGIFESDAGTEREHRVWGQRGEPDGDGDPGGESDRDGDDHGDGERRDEQRERHVCADGQRGEHAADDFGYRRSDDQRRHQHGGAWASRWAMRRRRRGV